VKFRSASTADDGVAYGRPPFSFERRSGDDPRRLVGRLEGSAGVDAPAAPGADPGAAAARNTAVFRTEQQIALVFLYEV